MYSLFFTFFLLVILSFLIKFLSKKIIGEDSSQLDFIEVEKMSTANYILFVITMFLIFTQNNKSLFMLIMIVLAIIYFLYKFKLAKKYKCNKKIMKYLKAESFVVIIYFGVVFILYYLQILK